MTSYPRYGSDRPSTGWMPDADRLMALARAKPEALLLVGAGLALLMRGQRGWPDVQGRGEREGRQGVMSSARETMRGASESLGEASESMTGYASQMVRQAGETASEYASSASHWAGDAQEGLMEGSSWLAERARSLPYELDEAVQDHPLVLAALGVAVGAALGASLPATSLENRTLGETRDHLAGAAQQASSRLGAAAEQAYAEARRTAESWGESRAQGAGGPQVSPGGASGSPAASRPQSQS